MNQAGGVEWGLPMENGLENVGIQVQELSPIVSTLKVPII